MTFSRVLVFHCRRRLCTTTRNLIRAAGGDIDALPTTWDDIIALADQSREANRGTYGLHYDWEISGNWLWQFDGVS